jgi:hypothetical protein
MSASLKESCKQILQRLQQRDVEEFACVLCCQRVRGQDALMQHLITEHGIHCVHFDNVSNLTELLAHLSQLLHNGSAPSHWTCPVCGEDTHTADVEALLQHTRERQGHDCWNPNTIPRLARWCVLANDTENSEASNAAAPAVAASSGGAHLVAKDDDDDEDDAAWDATADEEVDDDDDWNLDCVCLYCDYYGEDVLEHLKSDHEFDFRAAVQQRADVLSEYDLIRIVNAVRRAIAADRCPYDASCAVDGNHNDRAALEQHLVAHKDHRLPARVSQSDSDLIPVLPGDAFISLLVTGGAGFLKAEEEDPDFPMVPTVQELAAAAREGNKKV